MRGNRHARTRIAFAMPLALAAIASAAAPPAVHMTFSGSESATSISGGLDELGDWITLQDGSTSFTGSLFADTWHLSWATLVDPSGDAFRLDSTMTVTNTSTTSQWFEIGTHLDVADGPTGGSLFNMAADISLMNLALTGTGEIAAPDAQTLTNLGINGVTLAALYEPLYSLIATGPYAIATDHRSASGSTGAVLTEASHHAHFNLSSGDMATLHSTTTITAIPAAPTAALAAALLLRSTRRGSRR